MSSLLNGVLSSQGPTPRELQQSEALEMVLRQCNCYESADESVRREEVLGRLDMLVKEVQPEAPGTLAEQVQLIQRELELLGVKFAPELSVIAQANYSNVARTKDENVF